MKVAALTCTGGRQETIGLCQMYLRRQTRQPDLWVVVDDVHPETTSDLGADVVIRPTPLWRLGGGHTVVRNFLAGLDHILGTDCEIITIFEDDDWYSPWYISDMARQMEIRYQDGVRLIGEMHMLYYNVRDRSLFRNFNPCHASFCTVSFHRDLAEHVIKVTNSKDGPFIDVRLWRATDKSRKWLANTDLCVGIKGIPCSRGGVTRAHRGFNPNYTPDPDLSMLRRFIGGDADLYADCFNPTPEPAEIRRPTPGRRRPARLDKITKQRDVARDRWLKLERSRRKVQ